MGDELFGGPTHYAGEKGKSYLLLTLGLSLFLIFIHDIIFKVLDCNLLVGGDGFDDISDRDNADQLPLVSDRKVAYAPEIMRPHFL